MGPIERLVASSLRQRVWVPAGQALARLDDAGLCDIVRGVSSPLVPTAV